MSVVLHPAITLEKRVYTSYISYTRIIIHNISPLLMYNKQQETCIFLYINFCVFSCEAGKRF
jgi:hypothetical protein